MLSEKSMMQHEQGKESSQELIAEFWERFGNVEEKIIERIKASKEGEMLFDFDDEMDQEELEESVEREIKFAESVIQKYTDWSQEESPIVLWDIDDTLVRNVYSDDAPNGMYQAIRVTALELLSFLKEKFPNITNGILSNRDELEEQLNNPERLQVLSDFMNRDYLYTSRHEDVPKEVEDEFRELFKNGYYNVNGDSQQKNMVINRLKEEGLNIKVIDDNQIAELQGDDGLYVYELMSPEGYMGIPLRESE